MESIKRRDGRKFIILCVLRYEKQPHWRLWTLLIGLLFLFPVNEISAETTCDKYLETAAWIPLLESTRGRFLEQEETLTQQLAEAQARADTAPDRTPVIRRLQDEVRQKEQEVKAKERDLAVTRRELAEQGSGALQTKVTKAQQRLQEENSKLERLDKLEDKLDADARVSELRRKLDEVRQDFAKKSGGQKPDSILGWINDLNKCGPYGTEFYKHCVHRGRLKGGYQGSSPIIPGEYAEILKKEQNLRGVLKDLAEKMQKLPGKLTDERRKAEERVLTKDERQLLHQLRPQRSQLLASVAQAKTALEDAKRAVGSGSSYATRLAERVHEKEQELATLKNELAELTRKLEEEKNYKNEDQQAVEDITARLQSLQSDLAAVDQKLKNFKHDRTNLEQRFGAVKGQLSSLVEHGKALVKRAGQAKKRHQAADCQESLNSALDSLGTASRLVGQYGACLDLDPAMVPELDRYFQKARTADCGTGNLVQVPAVPRGTKKATAETLLTGAHLKFRAVEYLAPTRREDVGTVISVSPGPGEWVEPDTEVVVFIYNETWSDPEKADKELVEAREDGGAWDAAANNASVTTKTHTRTDAAPAIPTGKPTDSTSSQVDRAKEVAQEATAYGPQAEPFITPEAVMGTISIGAGIAKSTRTDAGTSGGRTVMPSGGSGATSSSGRTECPIAYAGGQGNAYYVIDTGGKPKGFIIERVADPPTSDADRNNCGKYRGAMKKCIEQSYRQLKRPVLQVLGPYSSLDQAKNVARNNCR